MATTQNIPNTLLSGQQTFNFTKVQDSSQNAVISIDRTVAGGLNSLTNSDTLSINIDRSTDNGASWTSVAGITCVGGLIVTKGVTLATETLSVGVVAPSDVFRIDTAPSTPVRITGTLTYQ